MKIVSTIEARMTSSRLPGKVLKPVLGQPMLKLLIERLQRSQEINEIVVATTINAADEPICRLAEKLGVGVHRGSEDDVLTRVLEAAQSHQGDLIVEITGDCPLLDPQVIDRCIKLFRENSFDYVSNTLKQTYPRGLDVQVFKTATLAKVAELTKDPVDHEHVSLYIYQHPETFTLHNMVCDPAISRPNYRLTLDTEDDLALITKIYEALYPRNPHFGLRDMIELLDRNPSWTALNAHVRQKEVRQ
jgi:spore coat polysaccharide biosynthesis protein SpsF